MAAEEPAIAAGELKDTAMRRAADLLRETGPSTDAEKAQAKLSADALVQAATLEASKVIAAATLLNTSSLLETLSEVQKVLVALRDTIHHDNQMMQKLDREKEMLESRTPLFAQISTKLDAILERLDG